MKEYRIVSAEGSELLRVRASDLIEAVTTHPACGAPLGAEVMRVDRATVLARRELWLGQSPGWSLITSG
jgi:hypothetical protein